MQYELKSRVVEPLRHTYQNIIDRYGDKPASRYLEGTLDIEPTENFHYRPTWVENRELYDARYSAFRLTDPYSFLDPRQYYYTPYVTKRSQLHEEFGTTISYLTDRDLLARLPENWRRLLIEVVIPLRHFESGAQLITINGARFAHGTSIEQCCTYAAFDRIGNAQMLSRVGLALGDGKVPLEAAKSAWMDAEHLQPLRELTEHLMIEGDWADAVLAVDHIDGLLYPALYTQLDEEALIGGAGPYSMIAQHLASWYVDQSKWLTALRAAWTADPEHGDANQQNLDRVAASWSPQAGAAASAIAAFAANELDIPLEITTDDTHTNAGGSTS